MSWVSNIIRRRRLRQKEGPGVWQGLTCATILGLMVSVVLVSSSFIYSYLTRRLPSLDLLPLYFEPPEGLLLQPTQLLDRTGTHVILTLANPAATGSQYLTSDQLPEKVVQAVLASTDPTFWQNPGFSWKGLAKGTHPTIAQRIAEEFLLKDEPPGLTKNFSRKIARRADHPKVWT